ncbi:MAG: TIGR00366 family protein [Thermoanaerobaculales bacterium]|nr:TIGR00366 family protein [Thermoanaerobaculales bacterium]
MRKVPDVFVIVFALILLAAVLTWVLPGGSYDRIEVTIGEGTREVVDPGSFRYEDSNPQTIEIFTAPINGFLRHGITKIVIFIFLVGGSFYVLNETGAIAAGIQQLVRLLKGREFLVIPIVMTIFSLFGAAFGMCEEAIPFVLIFVPLALALGYDSIVGVSLTFLAAGVGFAGAFLNPFTLQIAQGLADIQPVSGWGYRLVVWSVSTVVTIVWVMVYAARVKAEPKRSPMYELDLARREEIMAQQAELTEFTWRHGACLAILVAGILGMVFGVVQLGWYIVELAGLFFAMGILAGIVSGMDGNTLAKTFIAGCRDMAGAALIVGFAAGIIVLLEAGNVMDTILHGMGTVTSQLPSLVGSYAMYFMQVFLNFFIPSGSTKAALTMPLMAPLADISGITRQTAVLAYQLGDGFTNMIIPTSGVTVGTLAMAKIPYEKWFRWNLPMQLMFVALSLVFLIWPVMTGWM